MILDDRSALLGLQQIDCNCNDCIFMQRDQVTYNHWKERRRASDEADFEVAKAKAVAEAHAVADESNRRGMVRVAEKMRFVFDGAGLISYGTCTKFNKAVSFLPGTCQIETQACFLHRKSAALVLGPAETP